MYRGEDGEARPLAGGRIRPLLQNRRHRRRGLGEFGPCLAGRLGGNGLSRRFAEQATAHEMAHGGNLAIGKSEIQSDPVAAKGIVQRDAAIGRGQPAASAAGVGAGDQRRLIQLLAHAGRWR
jgi:hypothetical protein